jgi:prepilin-type N-terminal cleavage/methylation domain-containing protein
MKSRHKTFKGFTLIELLVVISIISLLSSVVLASLNTARGKGADASIKSNLSQIRTQAELYYDINGDYATIPGGTSNLQCDPYAEARIVFKDTVVKKALISAMTQSGVSNNFSTSGIVCSTNASPATSWAISVPLKSVPTNSWCVDSTGKSKQITGAITTSACP